MSFPTLKVLQFYDLLMEVPICEMVETTDTVYDFLLKFPYISWFLSFLGIEKV